MSALLVLFALNPGAAFKMVPDTVAEEALTAAKDPTAGDAIRVEESKCTFNWTDPATGRSSCHILVEEKQDFSSAEGHCIVEHGGHLAALTTYEENEHIRLSMIVHEGVTPVWVGGYRVDNDWLWTTDEPFSFTDWYPGQPNGNEDVDVGSVLFPGVFFQWNDFSRDQECHFICES